MPAVILPFVTVSEYYVKVSNQKYCINIVLKSYSLKRFHLNLCILLVSKEKELVPVENHKYTGRMKNCTYNVCSYFTARYSKRIDTKLK